MYTEHKCGLYFTVNGRPSDVTIHSELHKQMLHLHLLYSTMESTAVQYYLNK